MTPDCITGIVTGCTGFGFTWIDGHKVNTRAVISITLIALLFVCIAKANPTPGPASENRFSIMQTLEVTYHSEGPLASYTMSTWILYGGPTFVYIWRPDMGAGLGVELGGELRKYFVQPLSGPFIGGYLGVGALWTPGEEQVEAISTGAKLGWRINLLNQGCLLDLEPYLCIGVKLLSFGEDGGGGFMDATLYIGTKFDFY